MERIFEFTFQHSQDKPVNGDSSNVIVKEIVASEMKTLLEGKSMTEYLTDAYTRVRNDSLTDLPTRVAVMKALLLSNTGAAEDAVSLVLDGGLDGREVSVVNCRKAISCLKSFGNSVKEAKECFISKVQDKFPLAKELE